jgi:hypothetical protein
MFLSLIRATSGSLRMHNLGSIHPDHTRHAIRAVTGTDSTHDSTTAATDGPMMWIPVSQTNGQAGGADANTQLPGVPSGIAPVQCRRPW